MDWRSQPSFLIFVIGMSRRPNILVVIFRGLLVNSGKHRDCNFIHATTDFFDIFSAHYWTTTFILPAFKKTNVTFCVYINMKCSLVFSKEVFSTIMLAMQFSIKRQNSLIHLVWRELLLSHSRLSRVFVLLQPSRILHKTLSVITFDVVCYIQLTVYCEM